MISSDLSGPKAFKYLCKIIDRGEKQLLLDSIIDEKLKDFLARALEDDPDKRASIDELQQHSFLEKEGACDHGTLKLASNLTNLINKQSTRKAKNPNTSSAQNS